MFQDYRNTLFSRIKNDERSTTVGFIVVAAILALILINIVYLNFISVQKQNSQSKNQTVVSVSPTPSDIPTASPTTLPTQTVNNVAPINPKTTAVRDNFIPLGSGTGQGSEWKDIPGAQAKVDLSQYSPIKEVRFEASTNVPTGNESVSVRLYNVTDKHPVWYSEVTAQSNSTANLISSPLAYDFGEKLYQVQMKTELQFPANLTQARIHVVSK